MERIEKSLSTLRAAVNDELVDHPKQELLLDLLETLGVCINDQSAEQEHTAEEREEAMEEFVGAVYIIQTNGGFYIRREGRAGRSPFCHNFEQLITELRDWII